MEFEIDKLNSTAYQTYGISFYDLLPQQQEVIREFLK